MDPQQRDKIVKKIDQALGFVWAITVLIFPFTISTLTTEGYFLPKQILIIGVVCVSLLLLGARMALSLRVRLRRTPLDVPVLLVGLALLASSLLSVDKADALIACIPILMAILGYFVITNTLRQKDQVIFVLSTLVASGAGLAVLAIFSYLKVYPLPVQFTHNPAFTPLGTLIDQALYIMVLIPIGFMLGKKLLQNDTTPSTVGFAAATLFMGAGLLVTIAQLMTTQKPVILPFETGFQTAFASISQDTGRIVQGFFFGSGYGTFDTDFTRFKQASFNANPTLWPLLFGQSSSLVLELLATTGIVGLLTFLLLLFRTVINPKKKSTNPLYFSLVIVAVGAFLIPFSFTTVTLLFILLGIFSCLQAVKHPSTVYDIEPRFVAVKKGFISFSPVEVSEEKVEHNKVLPYGLVAFLVVVVAAVGIYSGKYLLADMHIQKALVAANNNNGTITYQEEVAALNTFPYQSMYFRIFSQTNIALANSIANAQPKGSSPSAQVQSTIYNLIQQGINTGRNATSLSPLKVANWQNLASIYRTLIGFGQGAENFAVQATQQAILLDPTNPQEFLTLGGLYYSLGQYDNAIRMFQQAISLKQDYPNAYYNLAHAYLQKKDPQDALQALQIVQQLTVNDKANNEKVVQEISQIQSQLGSQTPSVTPAPSQQPNKAATVQEPLNVIQPSPIPAQTSPIPLAPTSTPIPTTTPTP